MTSIMDSGLRTQDSGLRTQDSGLRTNCAHIKFEEYEHEYLDEIFGIVNRYSQMAKTEKYFLNGMVRYLKPTKILEVGIAHGGGSAIILNAIKDLPSSRLISVDYCEKFYGGNIDKLSGYLVDEQFAHLKDKWTVYRGGDISRFIERIGGDIDLLVLDTAHIHPWETLNFLCILPFMKRDSWVVLHDVSLPYLPGREEDLACRYLYGHVVSDAKIMPAPEENSIPHFSNIGAFHVIDDTVKYAGNLFESLLCPWAAMSGVFDKKVFPNATPILPRDLGDIRNIIGKYYPEYAAFFEHAIKYQHGIVEHKTAYYNFWRTTWARNSLWTYKLFEFIESIPSRIKSFWKHVSPSSYKAVRRLKRKIRHHEDID